MKIKVKKDLVNVFLAAGVPEKLIPSFTMKNKEEAIDAFINASKPKPVGGATTSVTVPTPIKKEPTPIKKEPTPVKTKKIAIPPAPYPPIAPYTANTFKLAPPITKETTPIKKEPVKTKKIAIPPAPYPPIRPYTPNTFKVNPIIRNILAPPIVEPEPLFMDIMRMSETPQPLPENRVVVYNPTPKREPMKVDDSPENRVVVYNPTPKKEPMKVDNSPENRVVVYQKPPVSPEVFGNYMDMVQGNALTLNDQVLPYKTGGGYGGGDPISSPILKANDDQESMNDITLNDLATSLDLGSPPLKKSKPRTSSKSLPLPEGVNFGNVQQKVETIESKTAEKSKKKSPKTKVIDTPNVYDDNLNPNDSKEPASKYEYINVNKLRKPLFESEAKELPPRVGKISSRPSPPPAMPNPIGFFKVKPKNKKP